MWWGAAMTSLLVNIIVARTLCGNIPCLGASWVTGGACFPSVGPTDGQGIPTWNWEIPQRWWELGSLRSKLSCCITTLEIVLHTYRKKSNWATLSNIKMSFSVSASLKPASTLHICWWSLKYCRVREKGLLGVKVDSLMKMTTVCAMAVGRGNASSMPGIIKKGIENTITNNVLL